MRQWERSTKEKFHRNLVLRVKQFDLGRELTGCYPGAVEGDVVGGTMDGKTVWVAINKTATNGKVGKFEDIIKPEARNYTPPNGYLAFNSVRGNNHEFKANWVNKFADPDSELKVGVPIQIAPVMEMGGGIKRFKSNNATMYRAFILNTHETNTFQQPTDVHKAVSEIFAEGQAAFLTMVAPNEPRETMVLWRGWRDGQPIPLDEAALKVMADPILSKLENIQQRDGKIDVVPLESMFVSPGTAESIDKGLFANIAIRDYSTGGIGGRIEAALKNSRNLNTSDFEKGFLAGLDKNAKGAFAQYGWKGVWTSDIVKFFQDLEIEPPKVPTFGYSLSTAVIKRYKPEEGVESCFLTKARSLGSTVSRDFVPTPSDKESIERFFNGFRTLVSQTITCLENRKSLEKEVSRSEPTNDNSLAKVFDNTTDIGDSDLLPQKTPCVSI